MQKKDFGIATTTVSVSNLFAGSFPRQEMPGTVVTGSAALKAGTVLGMVTASKKYKAYSDAASDGSEVAVAILAVDTDTAAADIPVTVYVTGSFNEAELIGLDSNAKTDLAARNIYVKEVL